MRWEIRDPGTGQRRYVYETFHGAKSKAERYWVQREAEIRAAGPGYVKPVRTELAEYLTDWLRRIEPDMDPLTQTHRNYQDVCRLYIVPHIGAVPLADLTPALLQDWLTELRQRVGPRTVTIARSVLRRALADAVRLSLLRQNPADLTRGPRQKKREVGAFEPGQADALIRTAYERTRFGPLFEFLWLSGLRPSEALGLLWRDVDLDAGMIRVRRSRVRIGGAVVDRDTMKTDAGLRDIALPARAVDALRRQRLLQGQEHMLATGWRDTGLVFTAATGAGLREDNVSRAFRLLRKRLALPAYPLYALRHTAASMQIAAGVPIAVVSKRLGHKHISVTVDTYGHLMREANRDAARALDEFLDRGQE